MAALYSAAASLGIRNDVRAEDEVRVVVVRGALYRFWD